ncbi:MAG: phosphotransferase [Dehalococcoidia bacterium]
MHDPALPTLPQVLDVERVLPYLAQALDQQADELARRSPQVELLRHRQGKRCAVRYCFAGDEQRERQALIGKVYHKGKKLTKTFARQSSLSETFNGGGRVRVARPLVSVESLGLLLLEYIDARDMRYALAEGKGGVPASLAGEFLARLHAIPPFAKMEQGTVDDELEKVGAWLSRVAVGIGNVPELAQLRAHMDSRARDLALSPASMIHRDFYYAHVLYADDSIWVLDFDQLGIGDPSYDLGLFLAHLEELAFTTTGSWDGYADEARAFVEGYRSHAPAWCLPGIDARMQFYVGCGLIKLASKLATRQPEGWREGVRAILERALARAADTP